MQWCIGETEKMDYYIPETGLDLVIEVSKKYSPVKVSVSMVESQAEGHIDGRLVPTSLCFDIEYNVMPERVPGSKIPVSEKLAVIPYKQSRHNSARKSPDFLDAGNKDFERIGKEVAARLFELLELCPEFISELRYTGRGCSNAVVTRDTICSILSGNEGHSGCIDNNPVSAE